MKISITSLQFVAIAVVVFFAVAVSRANADVHSPWVLSEHVADTSSMEAFANFPAWKDKRGQERAIAIWKYLCDKETGVFHFTPIREGQDRRNSELHIIRDPVKMLNSYGYGFCGAFGPTTAGIFERTGFEKARAIGIPGCNHCVTEVWYDGDPGVNGVRVNLHSIRPHPSKHQTIVVTHGFESEGQLVRRRFKFDKPTEYTIDCKNVPTNVFVQFAVASDFEEPIARAATESGAKPTTERGGVKRSNLDEQEWIAEMQEVHSRFTGEKGVFALFGDSITISRAFWFGLPHSRKNAPKEMETAFGRVNKHMLKDCWDRKGPQFGNQGSMTIRWAHKNVDRWLGDLNPEVTLIMFGTNDLHQLKLEEYENKTREVVKKCLDNGTVVILSTIPPRHGRVQKSAKFADAVRRIARDLKVPLTDFHAEILKRRPDDWDGALDKFKDYKGFDVPTLIARDGVHPSNPQKYRNDYSAEGLRHNGFVLRNYLALLKYAEVIRYSLEKEQ